MTDPAESHERLALSSAGRAKRDRMLDRLLDEMRAHHASRRARRVVVLQALIMFAALAWAAVLLPHRWNQGSRSNPDQTIAVNGARPSADLPPAASITLVKTPHDIIQRYTVHPAQVARVSRISDWDLLQALAELDQRAGIVRTGGRTWLTRAPSLLETNDPAGS